ncbi:MAG: hypothetical protein ACI9ES_000813 [Oceanospirillaceae bacterium]|jgi:hypothetical protein
MKIYKGSCHCQSVLFEVTCDLGTARQCDCSLCIRKGAKMVYANESAYKLLAGAKNLGMYQFNTHSAEHFFCKTCGIYTFHKTRIKPDMFGFNAGCLEGVDAMALDAIIVHGAKR